MYSAAIANLPGRNKTRTLSEGSTCGRERSSETLARFAGMGAKCVCGLRNHVEVRDQRDGLVVGVKAPVQRVVAVNVARGDQHRVRAGLRVDGHAGPVLVVVNGVGERTQGSV